MPSHGPKEPPDEDHGWSDMYEKVVGSEVGKAFLKDLWYLEDYSPVSMTQVEALVAEV